MIIQIPRPMPNLAATSPASPVGVARQIGVASGLLHDLNNVLTASLTLGTLLAEALPPGQEQSDAQAVVTASMRARELVALLQALNESPEATAALLQ
jgi:hypothetical protein